MTTITLAIAEDAELISQSGFSLIDVLASKSARIRRRASLLRAVALESLDSTQVVLTLEHQHVCSKIRSRIIATGDENVLVECGISIPIRCIHRVEFLS